MFVGIDWAAQTHAVCVLDQAGRRVTAFEIAHTAEGFDQLTTRLRRLGVPAELPVAIQRPDGRLVDHLLEAGHPVTPVSPISPISPISPNAIKAWREAEVLSGAKTDASDAMVIAEYLRLRRHHLRVLAPFSAQTRALRAVVRAVVRTRTDLVEQRVAAANQLSACLDACWPGALAVFAEFADIESEIALAFLERYPTPESAQGLGEARMRGMRAFCVKHGYCGGRPAAELVARLRAAPAAPAGLVDAVEADARRDAVLAMVAMVGVLRALNAAIKDLDRSVVAHLGEHPDAEVFTSLPHSGQINAAQVLAEWGDHRPANDPPNAPNAPNAVAALAGAAPVTKQSGNHHAVHFRWACNKRFRAAITTFADNSRHASPWAAKVDADARARGCDHPHAIRILARAWIRVIWACWITQTPYDPARHGNAVRLTEMAASAA